MKSHMPVSTGEKNRWEHESWSGISKIRCTNCDHVVMMSRYDFSKNESLK